MSNLIMLDNIDDILLDKIKGYYNNDLEKLNSVISLFNSRDAVEINECLFLEKDGIIVGDAHIKAYNDLKISEVDLSFMNNIKGEEFFSMIFNYLFLSYDMEVSILKIKNRCLSDYSFLEYDYEIEQDNNNLLMIADKSKFLEKNIKYSI